MSGYDDHGSGPKLWTIFDPRVGVFWRERGLGYTASVVEAGLFSEEFARRMTGPAYSDRREEARHLSTFKYILKESEARTRALSERFSLLAVGDE